MLDVFAHVTDLIREALPSALSPLEPNDIIVEASRTPEHGDLCTGVAMVLAKRLGQNPRLLAQSLSEALRFAPDVVTADVAGPGFVNITLSSSVWERCLQDILNLGAAYGTRQRTGTNVNVEYVSTNPTGPLHIGHARGAVVGDVLARLLDTAGFTVTKEYYINDAGAQVDTLARSAYLRYREAWGETIDIPEGLYPGTYLCAVGEALKEKYEDSLLKEEETSWLPLLRSFSVRFFLEHIKEDLERMGVHHDVWTSERALLDSGILHTTLAQLDDMGLLYKATPPPPKGKKSEHWSPKELLLFRSSDYGDDKDRALTKADGSWTYFANDVTYHLDKYQRGSRLLIDVMGDDHGGYVKRIQAAVKAATQGKARLEIKTCQLVRLLRSGQPVRMSKRAGAFVLLRDILDEVGSDALRFLLLTRKNEAPLDFDLDRVKEQTKDNPVFYVQYAHARCCSVQRMVRKTFPHMSPYTYAQADFSLLEEEMLCLVKEMACWPHLVFTAAQAREPHRVVTFVQKLAASFHSLWTAARENQNLRFVDPHSQDRTLASMAFVTAVQSVIASALSVLGVKPITTMYHEE